MPSAQIRHIAAQNTQMSLGVRPDAAITLDEDGIRTPEDMCVTDYGVRPYAARASPALTSVKLPSRIIGELAVSRLLQHPSGDTGPPMRCQIAPGAAACL